jgi:hypothetical protein
MKNAILTRAVPFQVGSTHGERTIFGASPPAVFVGHFGYPTVNVGPQIPIGDFAGEKHTEVMDAPETWFGKGIEEIVTYRSSMLRTNFRTGVKYTDNLEGLLQQLDGSNRRLLEATQELAMAAVPADTEAAVSKIRLDLVLDNHALPQGPAGVTSKITVVDNVKVDRAVEYCVGDTDLLASEAIFGKLYKEHVTSSTALRLMSIGLLGKAQNRKLVPTRWAITAIDDIISKGVAGGIRHHPSIDKCWTFTGSYLDNHFFLLFIPGRWAFEMMECWDPNSLWNQPLDALFGPDELNPPDPVFRGNGTSQWIPSDDRPPVIPAEPMIVADYELEKGRTTYASNVTGAYYAARKECVEFLHRIGRQARVLVIREVGGGYLIPLGVWVIRETVRNILAQDLRSPTFRVHEDLPAALNVLNDTHRIPLRYWTHASQLLQHHRRQPTLDGWMV